MLDHAKYSSPLIGPGATVAVVLLPVEGRIPVPEVKLRTVHGPVNALDCEIMRLCASEIRASFPL